ncbi:rhodanese-like domain-containing protein [Evansella clarkii]|jgi:rhodanese-related sulfurtransferase|uniref:rhodanese-like domain-containing protein n=1 Tax=Evansella clarkii TaxID=79879 RepID=UPI000B44FC9C|nr:rhodanese-like domain-containing protein [Evansella clarkii]
MKEYSPKEVNELIKSNDENIVVIDVRENEEVAAGKIPEAVHIPLGELPEAAGGLNKEKQYIMVCRSGARSSKATEFMEASGFIAVNMAGGMLHWEYAIN